jgi:hypothetical protein
LVLSWLPEDDPVCIPFARSLDAVSDNEMSSALMRLMFEFIENVHIAPAWWDALTPQHQHSLIERMANSANPELGRMPACLRPDGWSVLPWNVAGRTWLGVAP